MVECASILCRGDLVGPEHLLLTPRSSHGEAVGLGVSVGDRVPLEQIEEQHIRAVLASTSSIDEAAKVLGMDEVTLWRRRKKYGI